MSSPRFTFELPFFLLKKALPTYSRIIQERGQREEVILAPDPQIKFALIVKGKRTILTHSRWACPGYSVVASPSLGK